MDLETKGMREVSLSGPSTTKKSTLHHILKGKERGREVINKIGGKKGKDAYVALQKTAIW